MSRKTKNIQREGESIFAFIFRSIFFVVVLSVLVISVIMELFSPVFRLGLPLIYFGSSLVITLGLFAMVGSLFSKPLNELHYKYKLDSDMFVESNKVELIKRLCKYPWKLFKAVYCGLVISGIVASAITGLLYGMNSIFLAVSWACLAVFPSIAFLHVASSICAGETGAIIKDHFEGVDMGKYLEGKRCFGLSLNIQYFLFVYLPVFVSVALSIGFIIVGLNSFSVFEIVRIALFIIAVIAMCFLSTSFFMAKIARANTNLQKPLTVMSNSENNQPFSIPANYYSDLSYLAYMMNKVTKKYYEILKDHSRTRLTVSVAAEKIIAELDQTDVFLENQTNLIASIQEKILATKKQSAELEELVSETHRIALQTKSHADFGLDSAQMNIQKMDEITAANNVSVNDISSLSNEINSIWEIVNIINGIADRTKIIAFNAELEAEAFESENTSFKNVAVNIRTLADKIMDLTRNIRAQIMTIQNSNHNLILQGSEFSQRIKEGKNLTVTLEQMFADIQASAKDSVNFSQNISDILSRANHERERLLPVINNLEKLVEQLRSEVNQTRQLSNEISELSNLENK